MSSGRLYSVQALRAVAALLVVSHHAITMRGSGAPARPFFAALPSFDEFGCVGVDIFFVISGFIMAHAIAGPDRRPTAGAFMARRAARILPAFWAVTLITIAFGVAAQGIWPSKWSALNALTILPLSDIETFRANPAPIYLSWTLAFEIVFYLLVSAALLVRKYAPVKSVLILSAILALAGLIHHSRWSPLAFSANFIFAEFCLGLGAWTIWNRWRHVRASGPLIMSGVALLAIGLIANVGQGFNPDPALVIAGSTSAIRTLVWGVPAFLIVLGAAFDSSPTRGAVSVALEQIGEASYAIYLLHPLAITALSELGLHHWGNGGLFMAATVALSIASGLLFFRWFERPVTRMLHRRLNRTDRAASWPRAAAVA